MSKVIDDNSSKLQERVRDLHQLLTELSHRHQELLEVTQRKLMAMRKSDVELIQVCLLAENELADQIRQRDGIRRQLMVLIGKDLGVDSQEAKSMSMSDLLPHLEEKQGVILRAAASHLSSLLAEIAKVNTVVTWFAHKMLEHYDQIFEEITGGITDWPVYLPAGRKPAEVRAQVFETTG